MRNTLTRRDFLKTMGIGTAGVGAALALAACGGNGGSTSTTNTGSNAATNEDKQQEAQQRIEDQGINSDFITTDETAAADTYIRPELIVAGSNPDTLPPYSPNMNGRTPLWEIYQPLYEIPVFGGEMLPILADESKGGKNSRGIGGYDHEDGTTEYTVYMYDYITDSKGNNITANDVKFCYDYYYSEGGNENSRIWDSCEVVDDYTIKFKYTRELNRLLELDGGLGVFIYSQKAFEESGDALTNVACGTGRYILDELVAGSHMDLHRREDYWQDEALVTKNHKANVDKLHIDFITETAMKVIALQQHQVDMVETLSTEYIDEFKEENNDTYKVFTYRDNLTNFIYFNCHPDNMMNDMNMRLAVAWAINIDGLTEALGKGAAQRSMALCNANFGDYNPEWETYESYQTHAGADVDKAKEYLAAAGYKGETIEFLGNAGGDGQKMMEIIQQQLQLAGMTVHLKALDGTASRLEIVKPDGWNIRIQAMASKGYLASILGGNSFNKHEATADYGGLSSNFIDDDELSDMGDTILTVAGHTQENVDKVFKHIIDNCYVLALNSNYSNVIIPQDMTGIAMTSKNWVLHTACTFADPNA